MADTIYATSNISHGRPGDPVDERTKKIIPTEYKPGDVVDTKIFTKDELQALIDAGALSRENPIVKQLPPLTVDELTEKSEPDKTESKKP